MVMDFNLASACNTINPALFVLREKGYSLEIKNVQGDYCLYIAQKEGRQFVGNSAPEVLGLVTLWEHLGDNWREKLPTIPDIAAEITVEEEDE